MTAPSLDRWIIRFDGQTTAELHYHTAEAAQAVVDQFFRLSAQRTSIHRTLPFMFTDDWGCTFVSTLAVHPSATMVQPARQEAKFFPFNDDLLEHRNSLKSAGSAGFIGNLK